MRCRFCKAPIALFDKPPILDYRDSEAPFEFDSERAGWATDTSGDTVEDFICPARDSSSRYPNGKPHDPEPMQGPSRRLAVLKYKTSKL